MVPGPLFDKVPVVGGRVPLEWMKGTPEEEEWPGHDYFGVDEPPAPWALVEPGEGRLVELALPAAREAWGPPESRAGVAKLGIYLGLPEGVAAEAIVAGIQVELGRPVARAIAQPGGRASALEVLSAALQDLAAGSIDTALVGGVDSQLRGPVLERLEEEGRLRTGQNPQGFIPGEAAAFLVLQGGEAGRGAVGRILGTSVAVEPTVASGEPNQGVGLSTVLRAVRDAGALDSPPLVVCDLNGERYRALEWGLATTRAFGDLHGDLDFWHPADCIGDAGAALGVLDVVWGVHALRMGYAGAATVVVWGASDNGIRGACLLEAPGGQG
jgi:hypothetical protein